MKLSLVILALLAPVFAQAAGVPTLECNVITNGSGTHWENVFKFSAPINSAETKLQKTVVTAYGNSFSVDGAVQTNQFPGMPESYGLDLHVYLNNEQITLVDLDTAMGGVVQLTGNLADTHATFVLKNGAQQVSYGATCSIRPAN